MSYFNYHAKAKNLIASGHLIFFELVGNWNGICPALVLHFDNYRSMPIREQHFDDYMQFINKCR